VKKLLVVLFLLGVAAAIGYLFGTADGRNRREELVARARSPTGTDDPLDLTQPVGTVKDAAGAVHSAVEGS
jgi:hypothetical protein